MISMTCKLCAFINTTITCTDCKHVWNFGMHKIPAYMKRALKHTYMHTKKRPGKFSIFQALHIRQLVVNDSFRL